MLNLLNLFFNNHLHLWRKTIISLKKKENEFWINRENNSENTLYIDNEIRELINKCLSYNPKDRPNIDDICDIFDKICDIYN